MSALALPGLYIVSLTNPHPLPVNPPPRAGGAEPISVTSTNCKFGRAHNFRFRELCYQRQFGAEHVTFRPIATVSSLDDLVALETKILGRLEPLRVRGTTGRPTEWLKGISTSELEAVIVSTLQDAGCAFHLLDGSDLMSLTASDPWPPSPIVGTDLLVPITSWEMMLEETRITGVEFDGFWLEQVESGVAYFFRWLANPRATVLVIWKDREVGHAECRGIGDRVFSKEEARAIVNRAVRLFEGSGYKARLK